MAATETNYWKIGLFVASGAFLAILSLFWLASQRLNRDLLPSVTYFDESVQGLEIGAPVKMRGVTIGNVARITFAPDQRLVEVRSNIYSDVMERIGLPFTKDAWQGAEPSDDLRVQLGTTGITGVKYLSVDFFDPEKYPTLELSFAPPVRYVPSTPSTLKNVEDGLNEFLSRSPRLISEVRKLAATTESRIAEFDAATLSVKIGDLADTLAAKLEPLDLVTVQEEGLGLVRDLRAKLQRMEAGEGALGETLVRWGSVGRKLDTALDEAQIGPAGRSANEALGEFQALAQAGHSVLNELRGDLTELRTTLRALRSLAEYLERDPGALIRGRSGGDS